MRKRLLVSLECLRAPVFLSPTPRTPMVHVLLNAARQCPHSVNSMGILCFLYKCLWACALGSLPLQVKNAGFLKSAGDPAAAFMLISLGLHFVTVLALYSRWAGRSTRLPSSPVVRLALHSLTLTYWRWRC